MYDDYLEGEISAKLHMRAGIQHENTFAYSRPTSRLEIMKL